MDSPRRHFHGLAIIAVILALHQAAQGATYRGLFVGVNEFDNATTLYGCDWDAARLRDAFTTGGHCDDANAGLLINRSAKKAVVRARVKALAALAVAGDTVVYHQSSHGGNHKNVNGRDTKNAYLCLTDEDYEDFEFAEDLAQFAANVRVVVILDACYSGGMFKSASGRSADMLAAWNFASSVDGILQRRRAAARTAGVKGAGGAALADVAWITAADWNEPSSERERQGELTRALLRGWANASADTDGDKSVSFGELAAYAKANVRKSEVQTENDELLAAIPAGHAFDVSSYRLLTADGVCAGFLGTCPSEVVIPDGTTTIAFSAFDSEYNDVSALTSVTIPAGVKTIYDYAFYGCENLATLVLPDGLETIGLSAFELCGNLVSVAIPASVTAIGGWAFYQCASLSTVTFEGEMEAIDMDDSAFQETPWGLTVAATPTYTATFDAAGGTGGASMTLAGGEALSAPQVARPGYAFAGWSPAVPAAMPAGNVIYVAQWAATRYTVRFNANGGKLPKKKKMAAQTFTYGRAAKLRKNVFTREGWVFAGWAVSKSDAKKGVIAYVNRQSVSNLRTDGGTTTLYAVWAKPKYGVAFYANGGKGTMSVESFTYGKAKKLSANKFKAPKGKTFAGWAKSKAKAKKGVVAYRNKAKVKNLVITGRTVKLYAVWKKK